jgi:DNA invertase Pin-like site-specific DNA recombinase
LVQLTVTDRLDKVGARVLSTSEPDVDGPDELRELIRNILASIAAYERALIRGRMTGRPTRQCGRGALRGRHRALRLLGE